MELAFVFMIYIALVNAKAFTEFREISEKCDKHPNHELCRFKSDDVCDLQDLLMNNTSSYCKLIAQLVFCDNYTILATFLPAVCRSELNMASSKAKHLVSYINAHSLYDCRIARTKYEYHIMRLKLREMMKTIDSETTWFYSILRCFMYI